MKQKEFLKWLKSKGVTTKEGANHTKLYYQAKQSTIPRHPSKELSNSFVRDIKKQLGLD